MSLDQMRAIEAKYGFELPALYRTFVHNGWTTYSGPTANWLDLVEAEWMPLEDICLHEPEPYHQPGFVPFAFTGSGDHWCWWPEAADEAGVPVVCCRHDNVMAWIYSPDFRAFVYRNILEFACYEFSWHGDPESRQLLRGWHKRLSPLLPPNWSAMIADLSKRPAISGTRTSPNGEHASQWISLISEEEMKDIVRVAMPRPDLDREFVWMH